MNPHDHNETAARDCDWPGCAGTGDHRAPKARDRLNEYHWFCLAHVRDYNKSWDYFAGMEDLEYESLIRSTATWDRPTWPLGAREGGELQNGNGNPWPFWAARETAGAFAGDPDPGIHGLETPAILARSARLDARERKALATLELPETASLQEIKKRFKQLVKRYHPDANGPAARNDRAADERLRAVIQAYSHLVACGLFVNS